MKATDEFVPCLVKDALIDFCKHQDCKYLHKNPVNYFERKSEKIRQRRDFTYFEMHTSDSRTRWILPVNPYKENTPERNRFELFRQGYGEIQIVGSLPPGRFNFHREEISYKYITQLRNRWMIPETASIIELMDYEDVNEMAYYNGPI